MRDILATLQRWLDDDTRFAIARVVSTWGSAPRRVGATMGVSSGADFVGSVSGGCIEGSVIDETTAVIDSGESRLLTYGVDDETAWSVGLSCGGTVRVLVDLFPSFADNPAQSEAGAALIEALKVDKPATLVSTVAARQPAHLLVHADGSSVGTWPGPTGPVVAAAQQAYQNRQSGEEQIGALDVFIHVLPPKDRLIVVGGSDIAVSLVSFAHMLEFETVVVDPREVFTAPSRFAVAPDRILSQWPQEAFADLDLTDDTYAVLLTHDPKIDDPALHVLLNSPVSYIGALGSTRTHARRKERLRAAGFSDAQTDRIRGPVGIDIAAATPGQIALSIMAEVVETKNRRGRDA